LNSIARMPANERTELFAETADRKGLPEAIIEKDFWVCWVLKQLFSIDVLSGRLLFKGGTSLSKIFHAINRFSEDIDLAVDYVALGFTGERDPRRAELSKTKRAALLAEMMIECQRYIGGEFLEALQSRCREILVKGLWCGLRVQDSLHILPKCQPGHQHSPGHFDHWSNPPHSPSKVLNSAKVLIFRV
jgi:hypothetical protein